MTVVVEHRGPVRVLTLDRPARRNAIDAELSAELNRGFDDFADDPVARVLVLAANGPVFCAGADILTGAGAATPRGGEYGVVRRALRKPVIAAVEGPALGGGFELVLSCHLVVASTTASFSLPEARRGRLAKSGGLFRAAQRLPAGIATELLLTGTALGAERAHALGLVNRLTPPGAALAGALALAEEILEASPLAVEALLGALLEVAAPAEQRAWSTGDRAAEALARTEDRHEGDAAFREHRPPRWAASGSVR